VVIDVGFGDAIEPGLNEIELPVLLDQPAPKLRAYAMETVIAEKFQAMVALGRANSRMKDFYDLWFLARTFTFEDDRLARAIAATFKRRQTQVPVEVPDALTDAFAKDDQKRKQWTAFVSGVLAEPVALDVVVPDLRAFLIPHAEKARLSKDA
jgi:predicted nucleotidyltransferase component of viral defense system